MFASYIHPGVFRVVFDTAAIFVCLWYRVFCVITVVVDDVDVVGCSVNNMNIIRAFHDRLISLYQHRIHWHAIKMCNGYFMGLLHSAIGTRFEMLSQEERM